jgi:hypothetical protein
MNTPIIQDLVVVDLSNTAHHKQLNPCSNDCLSKCQAQKRRKKQNRLKAFSLYY